MPIYLQRFEFDPLPPERIGRWRAVPPAVASDCMNRSQTMAASMKALATGMRLCGQARTVQCMVGDNGPIHAAMRLLRPGEILVIDAGGYPDTAVFGGLLTHVALARECGGAVVHGGVRDREEIVELEFPVFATAIVPAGPHKGFGGTIDGTISCAGCPVSPGDIVLGDGDGIAVVPLGREDEVLQAATAKLSQEAEQLRRLQAGESLADQLGIEEPQIIP